MQTLAPVGTMSLEDSGRCYLGMIRGLQPSKAYGQADDQGVMISMGDWRDFGHTEVCPSHDANG